MTVTKILSMSVGLLILPAVLLLAACGGHSTQAGKALLPVQDQANEDLQLPGLADLNRDPAGLVNIQSQHSLFDGSEYCGHLPHRNISEIPEENAILLDPDADGSGIAFAIYQMFKERSLSEAPAFDPLVHMDLSNVSGDGQLYFLVVDYEQGRWQVLPLQLDTQSGRYDADFESWDYRDNEFAVMSFGILAAGNISAQLNRIQFGDGFRPYIRTQLIPSVAQGSSAELEGIAYVYPPEDPQYGDIASVGFDFDNDGTIDQTGSKTNGFRYEAALPWILAAPGLYTPRVVVTSTTDAVYEYIDRLWLGVPDTSGPTAQFSVPDGPYFELGDVVTLDASGSTAGDGAVTDYFWYLNDRLLGSNQTGTLLHGFQTAGSYDVTVMVVDDNYNLSSAHSTIVVGESGYHWNASLASEPSLQGIAGISQIAAIAGHPALLSEGTVPGGVGYVRALDAGGGSWPQDGSQVIANDENHWHYPVGLLEIEGKPAAFCLRQYNDDSDPELYLSLATDVAGTDWGAPQLCFSEAGLQFHPISMNVLVFSIAGIPAVAYRIDDADMQVWQYRSAAAADGSAWNTAVSLPQLPGWDVVDRLHFADYAGKPCLAWAQPVNDDEDAVMFMLASQSDGSAWNSPVEVHREEDHYDPGVLDLAIIGGRPALALFSESRPDCISLFDRIGYAVATDEAGATWSEARFFSRLALPLYGRLMEIDNRPAVITLGDPYVNAELMLTAHLARNAEGTRWLAPNVMEEYIDNSHYMAPDSHIAGICLDIAGVPTALLKRDGGGAVTARLAP